MGNLMDLIYRKLYTEPNEVSHPWCGTYVAFCMFAGTRASTLPEAQADCSVFREKSWPIELGGNFSKEVFVEYVQNTSISNIILNARRHGKSWFWLKSNTEVENFENITVEGDILVHHRNASDPDYKVVCMLACRFIWNEFTDTRMNTTTIGELTNAVTVNDCKDACQRDPGCSSVDMTWMLKVSRCWLHPYPYNASLIHASPKVSHFVIDRSSRTVRRCFGVHDVSRTIYMPTMLYFIAVGLAAMFAAIIAMTVFCITLTVPVSTASTAS